MFQFCTATVYPEFCWINTMNERCFYLLILIFFPNDFFFQILISQFAQIITQNIHWNQKALAACEFTCKMARNQFDRHLINIRRAGLFHFCFEITSWFLWLHCNLRLYSHASSQSVRDCAVPFHIRQFYIIYFVRFLRTYVSTIAYVFLSVFSRAIDIARKRASGHLK